MKVNKSEYSECTFWVVECPGCGERIEIFDETDNNVECCHCSEWFEVDHNS